MRSRNMVFQSRTRFWVGLILCSAVSIGVISRLAAELQPAGARERQVTKKVVDFVTKNHLSRASIDDQTSARALKLFLNSFDPMKVYFLQSDVDEFRTVEKSLDDDLKQGKIQFAFDVYNRFLQRVDERLELVAKLLEQPIDFTVQETMKTDPDEIQYVQSRAEMNDRWRKRIKYDLLVLKSDKVEGDEAREKLTRRYQNFARRMRQFDVDELMEAYLNSFTMSFDPHTTYMSPSQFENFTILMSLNLEGIGAQLQTNDYGYTVVARVVPGGAAEKHGKLKAEDRIVSVGQGDEGEMVDVVETKLTDVVKLIRGKAGTVVRLGILPAGESETKIYRIVRAKVELKDSEARGEVFDSGRKENGEPYRVGVIDLPSFYKDMDASGRNLNSYKSTTRDVQKILEDFHQKQVDAVILDLRRNGGGFLDEAINLTGLFIDEGPVVQVRDSDGKVNHYDDTAPGMTWGGPLVVLTSKFSASASEILAGAVQDYRRGLVVGDKATHGKGTVQTLSALGPNLFNIANPPNHGAIKITVQQFYRPNGDSTQQRGVLADLELPSISEHMPVGESDLEYSLPFGKVDPARFVPYDMVNSNLVKALHERSQARVAGSEEFHKLLADIEKYTAQRKENVVSLSDTEFFAKRGQLDSVKEDEKQLESAQEAKNAIKRDYYLNEVMAITTDYMELLRQNPVAAAKR